MKRLEESLDFAIDRTTFPPEANPPPAENYYTDRAERVLAEIHQVDLQCLRETHGWASERLFDWANSGQEKT